MGGAAVSVAGLMGWTAGDAWYDGDTKAHPHSIGGTIYREAVASGVAGISVETFFYGLDSYKTRVQSGVKVAGVAQFRGLFRGLLPVVMTGSAPSFATFFSLYEPLKIVLADGNSEASKRSILLASAVCAVPASLVAVPSDVLKKRLVLGLDDSAAGAVRNIMRADGAAGLFVGWRVNLVKDVPFAVIKMSSYEALAMGYRRWQRISPTAELSKAENSGVGLTSGCITAVLSCPLDVVNTRLKSLPLGAKAAPPSMRQMALGIVQKEGARALFRGVVPRAVIVGLGSSVFWPIYHSAKECL